ncbi:MAG: tetratricopeptide repeat protein [Deltaproteobacteria bacterium]|nr:tetratricopeptide repeat protein [Deltaproteobacteria bacterium]MBM4287478.1 tetratricopeptide repeat protein [Deltaproteobacteria bacterium]
MKLASGQAFSAPELGRGKLGILASLVLASALVLVSCLSRDPCTQAREHCRQAAQLSFSQANILKKEQLYRKALELCPGLGEAHYELAAVLERQGRYPEAIFHYQEAIRLLPKEAQACFALANLLARTNRPREAARLYEEGLRRKPEDRPARQRLADAKELGQGGLIRAEVIERSIGPLARGVGGQVSLTLGEKLIPFDFDKYDIRPDARPQLDELGKALKNIYGGSRDIVIAGAGPQFYEIAGHTDVRGADAYNLWLSRKRAEAVVDYLHRHFALPRERLIARGYGKRRLLCTTGPDEGCHALNRRVEVVRLAPGSQVAQRGAASPAEGGLESPLILEAGFFYLRPESDQVAVLQEDSRLRSRQDKYFVFFRPRQDCYVHILQEDAAGKVDLLFPQAGESAKVLAGRDYWLPAFGKAFSLDDVRGEEKLYLLASAHPLETALAGLPLAQQVRSAVAAYRTRALQIVRPEDAPESLPAEQLSNALNALQKITPLLEKVAGDGNLVKVVIFYHE